MDNAFYLPAITALKRHAEQAQHRGLLVLSGDREWGIELACVVAKQLHVESTLWLTDRPTPVEDSLRVEFTPAKKAIRNLGGEQQLIVMDAYAGFHPDGFGAISGTLKAGGLFILLTPDSKLWSSYDDPDYERITSLPFCRSELTRRFISRINNAICCSGDALHIRQGLRPSATDIAIEKPIAPSVDNEPLDGCLTKDQQQAVDAVCRVVTGHRRRPLVLTSDRGRGKTATLGLAAARLINRGAKKIILTAPFPEAVDSAFLMLEKQFSGGQRNGNQFSSQSGCPHEVEFIAPDELISEAPDADVVLVDEAAAIPVPMLEKLLKRYSRIVFASTIHGYEGTGRGFAVRFTKVLDKQTPQWRSLHLKSPIRWADNDPLERFVFNALLLNATPVEPNSAEITGVDSLSVRWIDQNELSQDEELLNQIFGLLVLAHYRTSPDDLRMLLDGPSLRIATLFDNEHVVAVALVAREGGLERELGDLIWQGRRRPRGHLIPQVLSCFGGFQEATDMIGDRVMRIAVHPALHRLGLGAHLINEIFAKGAEEGVDYIGSSFGVTPDLLDFWQSIGFIPLRIGLQREAASGAHSAVVMKPISDQGEQLSRLASERFFEQFLFDLSDTFKYLDIDIGLRLLSSSSRVSDVLSERDCSDLNAFTEYQRIYESCSLSVSKLVMLAAQSGVLAKLCSDQQVNILVRRVIQKNSVEAVISEFRLTGKKALNELIVSATRHLFLWFNRELK